VRSTPGRGLRRVELIQQKMVLFAPIPSASVRTATAVNPGLRNSMRKAYLRSWSNVDIELAAPDGSLRYDSGPQD